jgi:hypothetical protein
MLEEPTSPTKEPLTARTNAAPTALCRPGAGRTTSLYGVGIVTDAENSPHLLIDRIKGEMYFGFAETDEHVPANVIRRSRAHSTRQAPATGSTSSPTGAHAIAGIIEDPTHQQCLRT